MQSRKHLYTVLIFLTVQQISFSQTFEEFFPSFYLGQDRLDFGAIGSINSGQFSSIDLDNDGKKDLFVFDRQKNGLFTYLNKGDSGEIKYEYAPQYLSHFPELEGWALLVDFNKDGIEDIFTLPKANVPGIEVWRGNRDANGLYFERMTFGNALSYLTVIAGNAPTNLYSSIIDIPAIADVDGDGDTDVLTFEFDGSYLSYFRNYTVEKGFGIDTFDMKLEDICFGKFEENALSAEITFSPDGLKCGNSFRDEIGSGPRHSGSTVTAFDGDCDGDVDLLIGDLSTNNITYLINNGTKTKAWVKEEQVQFPAYDVSANIEQFLAAYYLDVNNDGIRDLIVTPNQAADNKNHVWLYLNTGSDCAPNFVLESKNFLVNEILQAGGYSSPVLVDINADGLLDLVFGGNKIQIGSQYKSGIQVYLNNGTKSDPKFVLQTDDYLSISSKFSLIRLSPNFGDLDGDGDLDLLVGESNGSFIYFENTAGKNAPFQFKDGVYPYAKIDVGNISDPQVIDVNKDGLNDLIFGEDNFEIQYFQNYGSIGQPIFYSKSDTLSNVVQYGKIYTTPVYALKNGKLDLFVSEGKEYLLQGTLDHSMRLFGDLPIIPTNPVTLVDDNFGDFAPGQYINPSMADLDGDNYYDLVFGDSAGAIRFFRTYMKVNMGSSINDQNNKINPLVYPNPLRNWLNIGLKREFNYQIFDLSGLLIISGQKAVNFESIDCSQLRAGVYILKIQSDQKTYTQKIIKI